MSEAVENKDEAQVKAEIEASMAAAFERARGGSAPPPQDDPPPDETPPDDAPAGESDQHVDQVEDDKPADPPPPKVEADPMEKRVRTIEGHYGSLNRDLQKMAADLAKLANPAASAPTAAQIAAANTDAKMANLREIYPDFSEALDEQVSKIRSEMLDNKTVQKIIDEKVNEGVTAALEIGHINSEANHYARSGEWQSRDWKKTIYSPEFKTWLAGQDDDMRAKRESDYGRDVVDVLDAFEKSRKTPAKEDPTPAPKRGHRLEDSAPATRGNGPTRTPKVETVEEAMERRFRQTRGEQKL